MFEIRIHGRGGQGAKSASQFAAEAAMAQGKHIQAFPEYGPERSGAPVASYVRISKDRISTHQAVDRPDAVLVLDPTLVKTVDVTAGLKKEGLLVVNSPKEAKELKKELGFSGRLYAVDASEIAINSIGRDIPNTAILGALAALSDAVDKKALTSSIRKKFIKKLGKEKTEGNVRAVELAYKTVAGQD